MTAPLRWRGLELPPEDDHEWAPDAWHLDNSDFYIGVARDDESGFSAYFGISDIEVDGEGAAPTAVGALDAALRDAERRARTALDTISLLLSRS
jgi:hypothetical protein